MVYVIFLFFPLLQHLRLLILLWLMLHLVGSLHLLHYTEQIQPEALQSRVLYIFECTVNAQKRLCQRSCQF